MIYTVVIHNNEPDCAPWVSSFSTRELADRFMQEAKKLLEKYGASDVRVESDCTELDSDEYLEWIDDTYQDYDPEEW